MLCMTLRRWAAIFSLLLAGGGLSAQMLPDTPVQNFRVPRFDDSTGFVKWVLRGESGRYVSDEEFHITQMLLRVYTGDQAVAVTAEIASPQAVMLPDESRAFGSGEISVTGPSYQINGSDWSWQGEERLIEVRQQARVTFRQDLGYLIQ